MATPHGDQLIGGLQQEYWREIWETKYYPDEAWSDLGGGGWLEVAIPEEYGGQGRGISELATVIEAVEATGGWPMTLKFVISPLFGGETLTSHDTEQIYPQTESLTPMMNYPDLDRVKPGAIGKSMFPDFDHEAWIEDDGNRLNPGEECELVKTDSAAMVGYYKQPEKTKETLQDRKIYSGDVVRQDEDGHFYYVDRKKFMVRRGGENISAQEVENVVDELDGVSESAIVPVPTISTAMRSRHTYCARVRA